MDARACVGLSGREGSLYQNPRSDLGDSQGPTGKPALEDRGFLSRLLLEI